MIERLAVDRALRRIPPVRGIAKPLEDAPDKATLLEPEIPPPMSRPKMP
jgi:hypothetical protein